MSAFNRRHFIAGASLSAAAGMTAADADRPGRKGESTMRIPDISAVPNFCSHEHWGSINAIGRAAEGFRADTEAGALPSRRTSVWDIVLDPYFMGHLCAAGCNPDALARNAGHDRFHAWWEVRPKEAMAAIRPHLEAQQFTGTFLCIRRGIELLYGQDIGTFDTEAWQAVDDAVADRYGNIFGWYKKAMQSAGFSEVIRPVHPEFYARQQSSRTAAEELAFTSTIMRIDPLLECHPRNCPRLKGLGKITGIEADDADSWRAFIEALFKLAANEGATGIKQLQAYTRPLEFIPREDSDVNWTENPGPDEKHVFQDWVMQECCRQAHERKWPHQIHTGTHNLTESSPLPLEGLARRYPEMKIVMLHNWPFFDECAFLAKYCPNVYIDTCWQPVLNPEYLRQSLSQWINYVPSHKIMLAHDSTSIEMAAGSSRFTREILAEVLAEKAAPHAPDEKALLRTATDLLHNNAVKVYGIGSRC